MFLLCMNLKYLGGCAKTGLHDFLIQVEAWQEGYDFDRRPVGSREVIRMQVVSACATVLKRTCPQG